MKLPLECVDFAFLIFWIPFKSGFWMRKNCIHNEFSRQNRKNEFSQIAKKKNFSAETINLIFRPNRKNNFFAETKNFCFLPKLQKNENFRQNHVTKFFLAKLHNKFFWQNKVFSPKQNLPTPIKLKYWVFLLKP